MWKEGRSLPSSFMPARGDVVCICDPSSYQGPGYRWLEAGGSLINSLFSWPRALHIPNHNSSAQKWIITTAALEPWRLLNAEVHWASCKSPCPASSKAYVSLNQSPTTLLNSLSVRLPQIPCCLRLQLSQTLSTLRAPVCSILRPYPIFLWAL